MSILLILTTALLITRAAAGIGFRLKLVDRPDARKQHSGEIPLTGGVAIVCTILAIQLLPEHPAMPFPVLVLTCAVFGLGLLDDYRHVGAAVRLLLHYGCGLALAWYAGITIHNVGNLLAMGDIPLLMLSVPLTALSVAGLCNAYNMIDGIDGLAASTAALPLLVLYLLALQVEHPMAGTLLTVLIPLGLFLLFNLGPNNRLLPKIFLGDSGSVTLGFMVTAALVYFSQEANAVIEPVTALWLVTLPLMDMLSTMLHRLLGGRKLMVADRSHVHHILMDRGLGPRQTLCVLLGWSAACAAVGLALEIIPAYLSLLGYSLLFAAHCLFVIKSGEITARLRLCKPGGDSSEQLQKPS